MKIWTCGNSPWSGTRNAWKRIKNFNGASRLSNFGIFSARSKWFNVGRDWWPWTKTGYATTTRRQSNNHWSGGIAAHPPAQKNSEWKNPLGNFSPRFFLGIKMVSSLLIVFQRAKLSIRGNGLSLSSGTVWYVPCIRVTGWVRSQGLSGMYRA